MGLQTKKQNYNVVPPSYKLVYKPPVTIVISTINHSYWSYKPTQLSRGPHILCSFTTSGICFIRFEPQAFQVSKLCWVISSSASARQQRQMIQIRSFYGITWPILPIGSMYGIYMLYMVTWIPSIYPLYVSIYTSTMDWSYGLDTLQKIDS